ncbi:hypothetical protein E2320_000585, partial [Naja naja]
MLAVGCGPSLEWAEQKNKKQKNSRVFFIPLLNHLKHGSASQNGKEVLHAGLNSFELLFVVLVGGKRRAAFLNSCCFLRGQNYIRLSQKSLYIAVRKNADFLFVILI